MIPWKKEYNYPAKVLITVLAVVGFLSQVTQMSILYFKYYTTTQVNFVLNKRIVHHSLVLCVRFTDILDRGRLKQETGIVIRDVQDVSDAVNEQAKLTVNQIFDYTPKSESLMSGCFYRPSDWTFATGDSKLCHRNFNITRYMTQEFMCYTINPVIHGERRLKTDAATLSHFKQFTIYDVTLSESFRSADHVIPITYTDDYPYVSRSFTDTVILMKDKSNKKKKTSDKESMQEYNLINISPNDYHIRLLEKPYVDACIMRRSDLYYECRRSCLMEEFEGFNKVPTTEILPEFYSGYNYDLFPITTTDLENNETEIRVKEIYKHCHRSCYYNPCYMSYTKTTIRLLIFKEFPLMLAAMTPTEADIWTESQARMSFVEYFSFICGCFGTWFGVSFCSLNRFHRFVMKRAWKEREGKKRNERSLTNSTRVTHTQEFFIHHQPSWKLIKGSGT